MQANSGYRLCLQGYIGSSLVWQKCSTSQFGPYYGVQNSGDTAAITKVRFEVLGAHNSTNYASISYTRP